MAKKEYYLYVKGKAVPVSEEVYKAYWKITEHEKYLQRKDWKHNVIPFSGLDHDGHCLFLRKCTVVPEERIPLFRSKYTVRPEQDTACIILASASLLA